MIKEVTDSLNNSATMQYDMLGRLLKATNPEGKSTAYSYDNLNRITEITDALNGLIKFTYDANGNLLTVTDAKNQIIAYTYNSRNKPASMTDQLGKMDTYTYDKNDNLISVMDRKAQTTTYTYDAMNRIAKATYADASAIDYTYDAVGRLTFINDSVLGPIQYIYGNTGCAVCGGALDKVVQEITPLGSITYEYDAISRRTKMLVAGQPTVNYSYDVNSRLTDIQTLLNGVAAGFSLRYDAIGRRTGVTLPNGVVTNYSYDNASRLLNLEHLNPLNQILEKISYSYDANGNRTSMNRLNVAPRLSNPTSSITYNAANQMLTFGSETLSYDNNGNLISKGDMAYQWNARNQLIGITSPTINASFKYDALGRRIEKTINGKTMQYLYDGADIVQEIENGMVSVNYIRTLNIDEPLARIKSDGTVRYYQTDALGSVIALTDETGVVKTQYNYNPFGNITVSGEASDNPFQYTGRENDGTGLYYYRARYYSPELQRFISEDPIGLAGGVNKFAYTWNSPVKFVDPLGLYVGGLGGFATGGISGNISPGIFGAGSASIVWDQDGNFGIAICGSLGVVAGSGIMVGAVVTNAWGAKTVCDLESSGVGAGAGGAGRVGGGVGGGGFVEASSAGIATGVGVGYGGWAGYAGAGGCKVYPLYPGSLKCKKNDCNK